ncbi:phosphonate metabolism transcriptional regulator PhnF [Roseibacterium sp. SDUM158016]|uniref:phosphonate metabolism transcriptional regulator PhnF n=1 Tax=Roseicyclus sediminis TaxID=2980997 RepID=UPI0021D2F465|nr:phosphonate metabolism transcriptional regulator PhnF [Roseibacterium sp. SDUM158016]MCU4653425.1 phosphonate metabolism transcriptional regulator PhnF [Roseibacterium sp. SDUM158016]
MGRPALWISIRDRLAEEIALGHYGPGDRLPTEAQLAGRFGVNRHTVRRALAALAEAGTVHARRGAGVYVQHRPTPYAIGRRVRFHQNLLAAGRVPEKRVLLIETRAAGPDETGALALPPEAPVHVYEGLSLSDGVPIALFRSVFPADRLPDLPRALSETGSVTAALAAAGVDDYTRARTEITAKPATPTLAAQLRLAAGAPILRTVGVNVDRVGIPVEYGRTWFAGDRVALTLGADDL